MKSEAEEVLYRTVYDRIYKSNPADTLYHYCSTPTLLSIIENNTLRFSDVNMMNDAREWQYAYELFELAAGSLLEFAAETPALEGLDVDFLNNIDAYVSGKQLRSHPIITCFSKEPDVLSQWRAYADNGSGWAIGFDAQALKSMPVTLLDVLYEPEEQLVEVRNFMAAMYLIWREVGGEFKPAVGKDAALLSSLLLAYKHPSFREEQEVRALHELRVDLQEDGAMLVDEGGTASDAEVKGQPIRFRAAGGSIVAYVDIPLERVDDRSIRDLWFGPRNENTLGNVLYPLTQFGHRAVRLSRSTSSYRG